jgi:hypothetical protein
VVAIGWKGLVQCYVYNQQGQPPTATPRRGTNEGDANDIVNLFGRVRYEQTLGKPDLRVCCKVKVFRPIYFSWRLQSLLSAIRIYREYICQSRDVIDIGILLEPNVSHVIEYPDQV